MHSVLFVRVWIGSLRALKVLGRPTTGPSFRFDLQVMCVPYTTSACRTRLRLTLYFVNSTAERRTRKASASSTMSPLPPLMVRVTLSLPLSAALTHISCAAHLKHGIHRVIVLDIDLHHGNGTQEIAWRINADANRVLTERRAKTPSASPRKGAGSSPKKATAPLPPPPTQPRPLQIMYASLHDIWSYRAFPRSSCPCWADTLY